MSRINLYNIKYDSIYPLNYKEKKEIASMDTIEWKALSLLWSVINFQPMYMANMSQEYDLGYEYRDKMSKYATEYPYAWYLLGWCSREHKRPFGLACDTLECFRKAAAAGVLEGQFALGNYLIFDLTNPEERQIAEGLGWLRKAAEQGLPEAIEQLVRIFEGNIYNEEEMKSKYLFNLEYGYFSEDKLTYDEDGTILMHPEQLGMVLLDFVENESLADYWRRVREWTESVGEKPFFSESLNMEWHKVLDAANAYDIEEKKKEKELNKTKVEIKKYPYRFPFSHEEPIGFYEYEFRDMISQTEEEKLSWNLIDRSINCDGLYQCCTLAAGYERDLIKYAEHGYSYGWYLLGWYFHERPRIFSLGYTGEDKDFYKKSENFYKKAISEGIMEGYYGLGYLYLFGLPCDTYSCDKIYVPRYPFESVGYILKAARNGVKMAAYYLPGLFRNDIYTKGYESRVDELGLFSFESMCDEEVAQYFGEMYNDLKAKKEIDEEPPEITKRIDDALERFKKYLENFIKKEQ